MLSRAKIAKPGAPLSFATFQSAPGSYQNGAVHLASGGSLIGHGALNGDGSGQVLGGFTKGVISFWMRYNSATPIDGDCAKISQIKGSPNANKPPSSHFTQCSIQNSFNLVDYQIQTIGIFATPVSLDLYLVDATTGTGLLSISLNYVKGDTTSTTQWKTLGNFGSNLYIPELSLWNDLNINPPSAAALLNPCGGQIEPFSFTQYSPSGDSFNGSWGTQINGRITPNVISPDVGSMRPISAGAIFNLVRTGPNPSGTVSLSQVPADLYIPATVNSGGTPTTGWHHYICSFDTSQLVTNEFGGTSIRAQFAMDRGGGPFSPGPLMDTAATAVGPKSQPPFNLLSQVGTTGTLSVNTSDFWSFAAPDVGPVDFAYCYMGVVPANGVFFDLTAARPGGGINLDYFISPQLTPVNLGLQGINVPLLCNWMHTGDATVGQQLGGAPTFAINAADFINAKGAPSKVWRVLAAPMTSTDGPPLSA